MFTVEQKQKSLGFLPFKKKKKEKKKAMHFLVLDRGTLSRYNVLNSLEEHWQKIYILYICTYVPL